MAIPARMLLVFAVLLASACARDDKPRPVAPPSQDGATGQASADPDAPAVLFDAESGNPAHVTVEVVSTPAAIQRGLMYRQNLAADHGMLFVFPGERVRTFWMKNTFIPLDMIFIRADMTVAGVVADAEPQTTTSRSVGVPSRYVLEVNAGWADEHGVSAGTTARFEGVDTDPASP